MTAGPARMSDAADSRELGSDWENELADAARAFDWSRVAELAQVYVRHVRAAATMPPLDQVEWVLNLLRRNLRYQELRAVADAALGRDPDAASVLRQYAQAL